MVAVGSKGGFEGVERALRFWLMLSSIEDLERRRNSAGYWIC